MTTGKVTRLGNQENESYNFQPEIPVPERFIDGTKGNITRQNIQPPSETVPGLEQIPFGNLQDENPAYETVYVPACTLLDIDQSVKKLFDESIKFPTKYVKGTNKIVSINKPEVKVAGGDRFALAKKLTPIRGQNGVLVLPSIAIRRLNINHSLNIQNSRSISSATGEIIVKVSLDQEKDPFYQNLINKIGLKSVNNIPTSKRKQKRNKNDLSIRQGSLLDPKTNNNIIEYLSMPAPTFVDVSYEIVLWTENIDSMNILLQSILSAKLPLDNGFVLTTDAGYWFCAYLGDEISMEDNFDDYSENEKIVKTKLDLTVKAFLLTPNDETNMYPIKKYSTSVTFDFTIKDSNTKTYLKKEIEAIGNKQSQDKFLLSDLSDPNDQKDKTLEENLYFEKVIKNNLTKKNERIYAEVLPNRESKEKIYSASNIDDLINFISDE
jgi:hypothetical protein